MPEKNELLDLATKAWKMIKKNVRGRSGSVTKAPKKVSSALMGVRGYRENMRQNKR
ncbi:hypothetical protein LCGC14_0614650 [marine sediment metagenome]|uniref:Uncharacterized protein n=1 Tax=marine sediment metagenome TaxID=412755 RepID=A0A0F9R6R3_9ZZZZ